MRIVGGSARGRRLKRPPAGVRPTADLVREAIFDVLEAQQVDLSRVLDVYAGSGALGIEALSRGDGRCDFFDREAANARVIRENLAAAGLQDRGTVYRLAAERAPERLQGPYSLVLADPPYYDEAALETVDQIARSGLVGPDTTLVLEHSARGEPPQELGPLPLAWSRRYGDTQVSIYRAERG
jgi:16S rRNA (guanine966-N2)-methyltransferase